MYQNYVLQLDFVETYDYILRKNSNFYRTGGITPKRVASDGSISAA